MNLGTNGQRILYEIVKRDFQSNTTYGTESAFFEFFSASHIMKNYDLSDEEIENGVLGSGNDGGCDAIYIVYNGNLMTEDSVETISATKNGLLELFIIQSKEETSFGEDAIMKWKTTSENLLQIGVNDATFSARYNEDVLLSFRVFRDLYIKILTSNPRLRIRYCYASFSTELHPNVQAQASELMTNVKRILPNAEVIVDFLGADDLLTIAQSQPEHRIRLQLAEAAINTGVKRDFIALVNLGKFYRFITDENDTLRKYIFDANVRDYQGHNAVNQDIQETLSSPSGEDFWWLNNGITILAEDVNIATTKEIVLTDPAIVNGLQTSNEIYQYFKSHPEKVDSDIRNILVRIIVPESEESRDKIVLATNNQTNIPKSSLRANDPIHLQIELYLKGRGLFYDRRKNYYKNQGKRASDIISVSFLSQCLMSLLLQQPNYARARPSTLLSRDETYNKLYIENHDLDVFYNAARIGKRIDQYIKSMTAFTRGQKNDILFYVMYYAIAKHFGKATLNANNIKCFNIDILTDEYISSVANEVFTDYQSCGGDGKAAKSMELIELLKKHFEIHMG